MRANASSMWMQGPIRWINQFGWRPIMQWEKWALFIMWRELSVMMGCKWVPQDLAAFDEFEKVYLSLISLSEWNVDLTLSPSRNLNNDQIPSM